MLDTLAARFGGTAYAVHQLASALSARPGVDQLVVVTRANSIVARAMRNSSLATLVLLPPHERWEVSRRTAWQAIRLPRLVADLNVTGVFSFSGMLPRTLPAPVISLLANPVPYEDLATVGSIVRRAAISHTSRNAIASYVPSHYVASLVGRLPRVSVVPLGVDRSVFRPSQGIGRDLLYVADFYRHKHHDLLMKAYSTMPEPRPPLRMIGNPQVDMDWYAQLTELAHNTPGATLEGRVSFEVLRHAYANALAFVITSDRESFSMSVAEAVCCGLPVLARDHPVLRETAGPAGLFVPGDDPRVWASALQRLVSDTPLRQQLSSEAYEHAKRFSWETMARQIANDFDRVTR